MNQIVSMPNSGAFCVIKIVMVVGPWVKWDGSIYWTLKKQKDSRAIPSIYRIFIFQIVEARSGMALFFLSIFQPQIVNIWT